MRKGRSWRQKHCDAPRQSMATGGEEGNGPPSRVSVSDLDWRRRPPFSRLFRITVGLVPNHRAARVHWQRCQWRTVTHRFHRLFRITGGLVRNHRAARVSLATLPVADRFSPFSTVCSRIAISLVPNHRAPRAHWQRCQWAPFLTVFTVCFESRSADPEHIVARVHRQRCHWPTPR